MDTLGLSVPDYAHRILFNYFRLKGYNEGKNSYGVYKSNLNTILAGLPKYHQSNILEIQEFASRFKTDSTRKNICVVIRWLWLYVYNSPIDWRLLPYPKPKRKVQPIYSYEESMAILCNLENTKQEAIIGLLISDGLRISEPCSILLTDCERENRKIVLRSNKGNEDRIIYPPENVWQLIDRYLNSWYRKPVKYLFEGQGVGEVYTPASIRTFTKRACIRANVPYKKVHAFRRFNITWSVENGAALTALAIRAGHKSTKTIERHYINHSSSFLKSVINPMDSFPINRLHA